MQSNHSYTCTNQHQQAVWQRQSLSVGLGTWSSSPPPSSSYFRMLSRTSSSGSMRSCLACLSLSRLFIHMTNTSTSTAWPHRQRGKRHRLLGVDTHQLTLGFKSGAASRHDGCSWSEVSVSKGTSLVWLATFKVTALLFALHKTQERLFITKKVFFFFSCIFTAGCKSIKKTNYFLHLSFANSDVQDNVTSLHLTLFFLLWIDGMWNVSTSLPGVSQSSSSIATSDNNQNLLWWKMACQVSNAEHSVSLLAVSFPTASLPLIVEIWVDLELRVHVLGVLHLC